MATNIRDKKRVLVGNGAPVDGDQLTSNNSAYPLDSVYVDQDTGSVYVRKDITKDASTDWALGGGDGTPTVQTVYSLKTTLTDAQIKALPTTYIELVGAPGANKSLVFHSARFDGNTGAAGYSNMDEGTYLGIAFDSTWGVDVTDQIAASIISQAGSYSMFIQPKTTVTQPLTADITNKGLYLVANNGSGDFTGGNAADTLEVTVFYSIVDL